MSEPVVIFPPSGKYGGHAPEVLELQIQKALLGKVKKAYVFGSFARGSGNYHSDIDLIIVKDTSERFPRRAFEFLDLLDIYPSMDILVYTPSEFDNLTSTPTNGFWCDVTKEMRQII